MQKRRTPKKNSKNNKRRRSQKGGLINRSFCKKQTPHGPTAELNPREYSKTTRLLSPGLEVIFASSLPFQLNSENLKSFFEFRRKDNKWFKFVIFKYKDKDYLYVMYGNPERNKHSLCLLYGVLDLYPRSSFPELRAAHEKLIELKKKMTNGELKGEDLTEDIVEVLEFNRVLFETLGCMEALSAGSGTILENGTICINNKSGHFAPKFSDLVIAQSMFREITGRDVNIRLPAEKSKIVAELSEIPGFDYYNFTGTCLGSED